MHHPIMTAFILGYVLGVLSGVLYITRNDDEEHEKVIRKLTER